MGQYVIRGGREGYERLRLLARARRSATLDLFSRVGIGAGMRCIDLGCGGGEVTFELAELVEPDGWVTGADMDDVKLDLARAEARRRGIANVEFRVANVNEWDEPAAYDVVYCRFLLQHLSRPDDLLVRMWAAVKPGGCIVVEDSDFDGLFCDPPNDGFAFYARMYPRVLAARGGSHTSGRTLYRSFLAAGIPAPTLSLRQGIDIEGESKTLALSTLDATADAIVADGLASEAEVRAAIVSLAAFTEDPTTLIGDPRTFQAWCRRAE